MGAKVMINQRILEIDISWMVANGDDENMQTCKSFRQLENRKWHE